MAIDPTRTAPAPDATAPVPRAHALESPASIEAARQPRYIAFLYRHPFVTDAYRLGFTPGVREDYTLQIGSYRNVDVPVLMLDNEFRDPDPERYIDAFRWYEPAVAVIGDAEDKFQRERSGADEPNDLSIADASFWYIQNSLARTVFRHSNALNFSKGYRLENTGWGPDGGTSQEYAKKAFEKWQNV